MRWPPDEIRHVRVRLASLLHQTIHADVPEVDLKAGRGRGGGVVKKRGSEVEGEVRGVVRRRMVQGVKQELVVCVVCTYVCEMGIRGAG